MAPPCDHVPSGRIVIPGQGDSACPAALARAAGVPSPWPPAACRRVSSGCRLASRYVSMSPAVERIAPEPASPSSSHGTGLMLSVVPLHESALLLGREHHHRVAQAERTSDLLLQEIRIADAGAVGQQPVPAARSRSCCSETEVAGLPADAVPGQILLPVSRPTMRGRPGVLRGQIEQRDFVAARLRDQSRAATAREPARPTPPFPAPPSAPASAPVNVLVIEPISKSESGLAAP